jgi:predicted alpha/beta hydrolase family esterase
MTTIKDAHFVFIHGAYGNPEENWFPWLKAELESYGARVSCPVLPTPDRQTLSIWIEEFRRQVPELSCDTVLIGHSLGCAFALNLLERCPVAVRAVYLISGFVGTLGLQELDEINETIANHDFNWATIKNHSARFVVINSDNDPYVPIEKGRMLAENLGCKPCIITNAGHINAKAGYTKFQKLLNMILLDLSDTEEQ